VKDMEYKFRGNSKSTVDAQEVGEELARINEEYGGVQTTIVVQEAEDVSSPLHKYFQWDDTIAGNEYRKHQARDLIRDVQVVVKKASRPAFVNIKVKDAPQQYRAIDDVLDDVNLWSAAISSFKTRLDLAARSLEELKACAKTRKQKAVVKKLNTHLSSAFDILQ